MEFENPDPRDPSHQPNNPDPSDDTWVTEEEVQALAEERNILGKDEIQQAEEILRSNLPQAVHSLVKLARSAQSETVRMNSAKYIVDRNLGRISDAEPDGEESPTEKLLKGVVVSSE